jgi:micrococcal nuclease
VRRPRREAGEEVVLRALLLLAALAGSSPALADPCKAIPDKGPAPAWLHRGAAFAGPVVYVGDGDSLCVDVPGIGPSGWVEVRLSDFYAPELHDEGGAEAKRALARLAKGRRVECTAEHQSYDRMVATCLLRGRSLGVLMENLGIEGGGRGR